jgi:hypothetical protein
MSADVKRKRGRPPGSKSKKPGPPTKLTAKLIDSICNAIAAGAYIETAAAYVGISKESFYKWLRKGARDADARTRSIHRTLQERVGKAMADAELADLSTIARHAQGFKVEKHVIVETISADGTVERKETNETRFQRDWTAAAWRLERKHPDRWGRRMALTGAQDSSPLQVKILLPEEAPVPGEEEDV